MKALAELYLQQLKTTLASMLQYRVSILIWMIGQVLEPLVYLIVWTVVSKSSGGSVDSYTTTGFAAYFIVLMMVNQFTYTWIMYEFEYHIREGRLSFALLKPVHPIHSDIADNISSKLITLPAMMLIATGLAVFFDVSISPAKWVVIAFIPVLLLAFSLGFLLEWTLALAAFWTTRVSAINQTYFVVMLFFSGQMAPLEILPYPIQVMTAILPFRWMIGFPVELLLGRLTLVQTFMGLGVQTAWLLVGFVSLRFIWHRGSRIYSAVGA
jgi:viologen exporter family transport system permease protein